MQETKKPSISLWVGVIGIVLSLISAFAAAADAAPETELKKSVVQLIGNSNQDGETDKPARCEQSVQSAKDTAAEARSSEELMSLCLALPNNHESLCGFPASSDEYYVVENQRCVSKIAGRSQLHAHARKIEARERPVNSEDSGQEDGDGSATGAQ